MKYIIVNDFLQILKQKYKYFITYFIATFIFLIFELFLQFDYHDILLSLMGIKIAKNNILFLLLYLSGILISLFIAYHIFSYDFRNSLNNIFLRVSPKKWFFCKSISCLFVTILFRFSLFLLISLFLIIFCKNTFFWLNLLFLKNIFYFSFMQLLFILYIYLFQSRKYISFFLSILISVIFLSKVLIFLPSVWWIYLFLDILLTIILVYTYENCFVNLFERNGG